MAIFGFFKSKPTIPTVEQMEEAGDQLEVKCRMMQNKTDAKRTSMLRDLKAAAETGDQAKQRRLIASAAAKKRESELTERVGAMLAKQKDGIATAVATLTISQTLATVMGQAATQMNPRAIAALVGQAQEQLMKMGIQTDALTNALDGIGPLVEPDSDIEEMTAEFEELATAMALEADSIKRDELVDELAARI